MNNFHEIMLYSWGDPLLNPDYLNIVDFLALENQCFSISTNASSVKLTQNPNAYKNCSTVIFSLSGITQKSYEKIHGFDIEITKRNIVKLITNMRENGFAGEAKISFHVYRFNKDEVEEAKEFAEKNNLKFEPVVAYLASWTLQRKYLNNELSSKEMKDIETDIITDGVRELLNNRPTDYRCPLENIISLDCKGKIELCCCTDPDTKGFYWQNITNIKSVSEWQNLRLKMLNSETCQECRRGGLDYWLCNNSKYKTNNK